MFSSDKKNVRVSVADNTLVVSFPSAKEPRVWRMDMGRYLSTALEIKEVAGGQFSLVIRGGNGPAEEIGVFADRKKAAETLQLITDSFLQGHGAPYYPKHSGGFLAGFFKFILMLALIAVAAFLFLSPRHRSPVNMGDMVPPPVSSVPPAKSGVPLPADEIFGN